MLHEESNSSEYPIDVLSFDIKYFQCNVAQGKIFKGRKSGVILNWRMTVDPVYKNVEKFSGGISWYMMENKDFISSISFELKNEINQKVSFNGQNLTFRSSIKAP